MEAKFGMWKYSQGSNDNNNDIKLIMTMAQIINMVIRCMFYYLI
jgi:hypothetical protein